MNSEEITAQSNHAEELEQEIVKIKHYVGACFIELARLLKEMRDLSLYKFLDCDTFEEFLGSPHISMGRSKVYDLIHVYELYVQKLKIPENELMRIGITNLRLTSPVVERNPQEWLEKAKVLSKSDLNEEIRVALGKKPSQKNVSLPPISSGPPSQASYLDHVDTHGCLVCGKEPTDKHHFPVTKGASCPDDWVVPLCRWCHSEYHHNPKEWVWENRRHWAKYFYDLAGKLFP